jgi:transcriptional regulator with XRE-family HTH domain
MAGSGATRKGMTQGQLARRSGLARSTISRLMSSEGLPSLDTVSKLQRALPGLLTPASVPHYLDSGGQPAARVEYALRMDDALTKQDVQEVMTIYLGMRRQAASRQRR